MNKTLIFIPFLVILVGFICSCSDDETHFRYHGSLKEIQLFEGDFRLPDAKPLVVIDAEDDEAKNIIIKLQKSTLRTDLIKFSSVYSLDLIGAEGVACTVRVGEDFIDFSNKYENKVSLYEIDKEVSRSLCLHLKELSQGAEGGSGSEEINP